MNFSFLKIKKINIKLISGRLFSIFWIIVSIRMRIWGGGGPSEGRSGTENLQMG